MAVDKHITDPLCLDDEDDRKWKRAVREAKEEVENKRKGSFGNKGQSGGYKDGYRRQEDGRTDSGDGRSGQRKREERTCHNYGKAGYLRAQCHVRKEGRS